MKRSISLLSALAFILAFSGSVYGQTVEAKANVITDISYDGNQTVNFGNIPADLSTTPTLDPADTQNNAGVNGPNVQLGYLLVSGTPDASVSVSWDEPSLSNSGDTESVVFTPEVRTSTGDATSSASDGGGDAYTEGNDVSLGTSGENGQLTLLIGGTLGNASSTPLPNGEFSGDVTFQIDYSF